jgi:glycosyltransferase involved in cell wall biosynthesis
MKKVLYIDRPFENEIGGDKNRSKYLYQTLKKDSKVYICLIKDISENSVDDEILALVPVVKTDKWLPESIAQFSQASMDSFVAYIKEHGIIELFFRTIAFSALATHAKKEIPELNIIIDADLILSRLMDQAWQKNRSLGSRYYLIQTLKLRHYEKNLYNNDFTILFSNEEECFNTRESYPNCKAKYLPNTTDLVPKAPGSSENRVILFYGSMDSTANIDGYNFIQNRLYTQLEEALEQYDYEIHVVGKGCDALPPVKHKRIKIIGKVDSIEETILNSALVLLPIYIASGTNTRVMETAMAGRPLITTPLGMEGLSSQNEQAHVAMDVNEMSVKVKELMQNKEQRIALAKELQHIIVSAFSYENFENTLKEIVEESFKAKIALVHVPRRFTHKAWGGTETVVMSSANNLKPLGYESTIYTSKALDSKETEHIGSVMIKRFDYFYPFFGMNKAQIDSFDAIGGNLFSFSLLFALLKNNNMDIIHLHTLKRMGGIVRTVAKWRKIPYVITLHGGYFNISASEISHREKQLENGYEWGKILGFLFGSRQVMDDASAIITLSQEEYDKAYEKYGEKVHYLSNGVDIKTFSKGDVHAFKRKYNIAASDKMILCSARIDTQKNQLLLLEVFAALCKSDDTLHLVLLGADSDQNYFMSLQTFIIEQDLASKVTFVSDLTPKDQLLVDAYKGAEMLVLPSRHEPFGMVILEAWSAGIPVVASLTGGIGKIISDEKNGLLFENGEFTKLYSQMERLLHDQTLKEKIIQNASIDVKQYDWAHIANDLDKIYKSALKHS